tara:strand:- start:712 stop:1359 length:648 start_codon:yes stop_codon:yes gene_type:complete
MALIDNNFTEGTFGENMKNSNSDNDSITALSGTPPDDFLSAFDKDEKLIADHRNLDYKKTRPPNSPNKNPNFFKEKDNLHSRTMNQTKPASKRVTFRNAVNAVMAANRLNNTRQKQIERLQDSMSTPLDATQRSLQREGMRYAYSTRNSDYSHTSSESPRPENLTTPTSAFPLTLEPPQNPYAGPRRRERSRRQQNTTGEGSKKKKRKRRRSRKY